jgi:sec-independent protein translocase protein TatA
MELFSPGHLVVLAILAAVLFFGWKQLPDMSRSLGRSLRIFKTEIKGMSEDDKAREAAHDAAATPPAVAPAPPAVAPAAPVAETPAPVVPPAPVAANGTKPADSDAVT